MHRLLLFYLVILYVNFSFSQSYQDVVVEDTGGTKTIEINRQNLEIEKAAKDIVAQIGLPQNFVLQASSEYKNNAVAKMKTGDDGRVRRYVVYDPKFFDNINFSAKNKWAAISILAHEIGHHLNNHSLNNDGSKYEYELLADNWSGFVLRKMGASLLDAQSAIQTLKDPKTRSKTHPPKNERLASIERGWRSGQKGLDKFTKEEEITAGQVQDKFIKSVGFSSNTKIHTYSYTEQLILDEEIDAKNIGKEFIDIIYGYGTFKCIGVGSKGFLKTSLTDGTQYLIKNNTNFYKKSKAQKSKWEQGIYPYMNSPYVNHSKIEILPNIKSPFANLIQELVKVKHSDTISFNTIRTIDGIPCFELEINSKLIENSKSSKTVEILTNEKYYYNVDSGLLYFISNKTIERKLKKQKILSTIILETETSVKNYSMVNNYLFPHEFKTNTKITKDGQTPKLISQTRVISEILLNPKIDEALFNVNLN
ncbi:hypothetical protein CLV90_0544 [Maribacter spongiicola]|uniref:Uncharacterized protein n=1 Tax=Maribacter spongiicola TaxID=1206753 RepID=A0A4V3ERV8_9FLAO|nr:hypothetical protein [Maribacter spongiicola]TDT46493.1 hypothetical protein CLV90_0544 [Maribacter spongiicola]